MRAPCFARTSTHGHSKTAEWYAAEIKAIIEESGRGAPLVLLDSAGECILLHCIKCIIPGCTQGCSARPRAPPLVAAAHTEEALVQCYWQSGKATARGQSPPPVRCQCLWPRRSETPLRALVGDDSRSSQRMQLCIPHEPGNRQCEFSCGAECSEAARQAPQQACHLR